jgi:hypothetical protein
MLPHLGHAPVSECPNPPPARRSDTHVVAAAKATSNLTATKLPRGHQGALANQERNTPHPSAFSTRSVTGQHTHLPPTSQEFRNNSTGTLLSAQIGRLYRDQLAQLSNMRSPPTVNHRQQIKLQPAVHLWHASGVTPLLEITPHW